MKPSFLLLLAASLVSHDAAADPAKAAAPNAETKTVAAGTYRPLFPPSANEKEISVRAFRMDALPVTNESYLAFVRAHAEWRRDRVAPVFADAEYLAHWESADSLGPNADAKAPVVDVSWFAANAYCGSRGMRLPREAEWEHAAVASRTQADGSSDAAWRAEILSMYSKPNPPRLPLVGSGVPNFWGIYDMHGVVWEWVLDFGNAIAEFSDGSDRLRFCGASGTGASDATDFAAFERVAFRSSLRARYAIKSLGFRCAADAIEGVP